jgi:hypothetical protein
MRRLMRRWIAGFGSGLLIIFTFTACTFPSLAETAILECVADGGTSGGAVLTRGQEIKLPGMLLVSFRTWNVTRWNVESATLLVHIARGDAPITVELAAIPQPWGEIEPPRLDTAKLKFATQNATNEPENWLAIQVPGSMVEDVAANRAHGFVVRFKSGKDLTIHTRESVTYAPYLIVTGSRR